MSDQAVARCLDALAELLAGTGSPDPQVVAAWHEGFKQALAAAERGPAWPELRRRGRLLGTQLDQKVLELRAAQESLKLEMGTQNAGRRALSAYGSVPG